MGVGSVLMHGSYEIIKNDAGIVGPGSCLRVSLKGKNRKVVMGHTLQTAIKQGGMRNTHGVRQALGVHRKTVILTGN
jgi:hypothetical protein